MQFVCEHCAVVSTATAYRVISEEAGVVLLDMIVCATCYLQATKLGLNTKKIDASDVFRIPRRISLTGNVTLRRDNAK